MIRKSIKIFLIGFVSGAVASVIFVLLFPGIYYAFLALLGRKIEAQAGAVGSLSLAIILNNLIASFLCSYGGFITTKAFLILKSVPSTFLIKLSFFDKRVEAISPEKFRRELNALARGGILKYFLVVALLIVGGILEVL